MRPALEIASYQLRDALRGRWAPLYAAAFFLLTDSLYRFSPDPEKVTLSLVNITMFVVPLISVIFGSLYFYNSRDFIELTLTQPVGRRSVFCGLFFGLTGALGLAYVVGAVAPFIIHMGGVDGFSGTLGVLLLTGISLTLIFVALAFLVASLTEDRGKGLGVTLLCWLWFALIYDGLLLLGSFLLYKYPLEKAVIGMILLNPIDLARILMIMQLDISALMGYTGAVINRFFGSSLGFSLCLSCLALWVVAPTALALRRFRRVDF